MTEGGYKPQKHTIKSDKMYNSFMTLAAGGDMESETYLSEDDYSGLWFLLACEMRERGLYKPDFDNDEDWSVKNIPDDQLIAIANKISASTDWQHPNYKLPKIRTNHVRWSIFSDTTPKDVDDWVIADSVGFDHGNGCVIPDIADGIYTVRQRSYWSNGEYNPDAGFETLKTEVTVSNGKISIDDCLDALDEFITLTGDHHYYLEIVMHDEQSNTLSFALGS